MTDESPTDAELQQAIKTLYSDEQLQAVGVENIVASLKASNPSWNDSNCINSERIQAILQENKSPQNDCSSKVGPADEKTGGAPKLVTDRFNVVNTRILELGNETSHGSCKNHRLESLPCLKIVVQQCQWEHLPRLQVRCEFEKMMVEEPSELLRVTLLAYKLFFAEWEAFLGPDPREPIGPVEKYVDRLEPMQFPTLFPTGTGHYLGPSNDHRSFDKYVVLMLQLGRFQRHAMWLQWTLTLIDNKEVAALVNLCLAFMHGFKARHVGEGDVQGLPLDEDFSLMKLNSQGTRLVDASS